MFHYLYLSLRKQETSESQLKNLSLCKFSSACSWFLFNYNLLKQNVWSMCVIFSRKHPIVSLNNLCQFWGIRRIFHASKTRTNRKTNRSHESFLTLLRMLKEDYLLRMFSVITFFYIHKKKVFDSWKFSTSGFRWIYMF